MISNKHQDFINEYLTNGHNATQAYKKAYPDNKTPKFSASRLLTNVNVKQAISDKMAKVAEKVDWSIEKSQKMLLETRTRAITLKQPAVEVSSVVAINRLHGMDKDAGVDKADKPKLSETEQARLNIIANNLLRKEA